MESPRSVFLCLSLLVGAAIAGACSSTGGSTTSSSGSSDDDGGIRVDLDGGGDAAVPPDGAALCPSGPCDYQTNAGCSAGASCLPDVTGDTVAPVCVTAGTTAIGAACVNETDCVAGAICAASVCRKLCCGGDWTGCDDPTTHCIEGLSYQGTNGPITSGAMLCMPINTCDALDPSSCTTSGTTCQIADPTGVTACLPEGTGSSGDACPCKGGFICTQQANKSAVCVRLCKAVEGGGSPECASNEGTCTHYTRDPAGVGECAAP